MIPKLNFLSGENCELILLDATKYDLQNKYEDYVNVDYIIYNKEEQIIDGPFISEHRKRTIYRYGVEPVFIPLNYDGWQTLVHIVLPKKEIAKLNLYYFDNGDIYLNNIKIDDPVSKALKNDSLLPVDVCDYVNTCFLEKCYIDLCQLDIEKNGDDFCGGACKSDSKSELKYKIQVLNIFLTAIKYMAELNMLQEIQELIDSISNCNGLCPCCSNSIIDNCNCK